MELYIDGSRAAADFTPEGTIEEVIREAQRLECGPERLVVSIRCDGEDVPAGEIAEALQRPADSVDRLDLVTSTKGLLVSEAMEYAVKSLDEAESALEQVASMFVEGRSPEAMQGLGECTRAWQQIHEAIVQSIELLHIEPDYTTVGEGTLSDAMKRPRQVLTQVRDALQAQDHVVLADILQYEFSDAIEDWHAVIARVKAIAAERDA